MIKKILYLGFQYDHGNINNGYAINYKAWYQNFKNLGYEVNALFYDDYTKEELQSEIIKTAKSTNPDLIFFILQSDQVEIETLQLLQDQNFFTTGFFGDDQWRFEDFTSKFACLFSACITTDKFSCDKYRSIGQKNIIRSQWASLTSSVEYENVEYKYDVSFVGGEGAFRKWFVQELGSRGISIHCFGDRWENGRVTYEEMEDVFSTSKINLNISNSVQFDARFLLSNPRNIINAIRSKKHVSQTKARIFEIPAQGGFEITEYVPCLEDYFDIGKEIICYKDVDEAEQLIKYYLAHENERETIKRAGVKKARAQHTFADRIEFFMKEITVIWDSARHKPL